MVNDRSGQIILNSAKSMHIIKIEHNKITINSELKH